MPTGFYGKLPAHGDFLRRILPDAFCEPWDAWLQQGMAAAREALDEADFDTVWATTPAWRFLLPAGACGPDRVAGLLLPSADLVGRRFPLTLAALLPTDADPPAEAWFAMLALQASEAKASALPADVLAQGLPDPWSDEDSVPEGWWLTPAHHWPLAALPPPALFRVLLEGGG